MSATNLQRIRDKPAQLLQKFAPNTGSQHRSGENAMVQIFLMQFLAAALGAASSAVADSLYRRARIGQRVHSFWVSLSIAVICLPILVWTCNVFLGPGLLRNIVIAISVAVIFFWVNQNLRKLPPPQNFEPHCPASHPSNGAVPPASRFNH
jgi:drug/metabolite transporter (DMT)-like permease